MKNTNFTRQYNTYPNNNEEEICAVSDIESAVALARETDAKASLTILSDPANVFADAEVASDFNADLNVNGRFLAASAKQLERDLFVAGFARSLIDVDEYVQRVAVSFAFRAPAHMLKETAEQTLRDAIPDQETEDGINLQVAALHYFREAYEANRAESESMVRISDDNPSVVRKCMTYAEAVEYAKTHGGILALSGKPGDGKTSTMLRPLFESTISGEKKATWINPRVSQCTPFSDSPMHYMNAKPQGAFEGSGLVGVSNSICLLNIFKDHRETSEVVILDEFEQLLTHNASASIRDGSLEARGAVTAETFAIIKRAAEKGVAVISDAFLNDHTVNRLHEITGKKIIVVDSQAKTKSRTLRIHKTKSDMLASATKLIAQGKNVLFLSGMAHNEMKDDLAGLFEHVNKFAQGETLMVDSKFYDNPENAEATKNIGEHFSGFQVVVASPVLNSSISIETNHFDALFIISTGTELPTEALQGTRRIRSLDTVDIAFDIKQKDRSTTTPVVFENLAAKSMRENQFSQKALADLWEKPGVQDVVRRVRFENNMRRFYASRLAFMAEAIGFTIEHTEALEAEKEQAEKDSKEAKAAAEAARIESVINAPHPTQAKVTELRSSNRPLRKDEAQQVVRFDTCSFYNLKPSALSNEIMSDDENGKQRNKIRKLQLVRLDETRKMTAHEKMQRVIIRKLFSSLKIDPEFIQVEDMGRGQAPTEFTNKDAQAFLGWLNSRRSKVTVNKTEIAPRRAFAATFEGVRVGKNATRMVTSILRNEMGLSVKKKKQIKKDGEVVTVYSVKISWKLNHYYKMATDGQSGAIVNAKDLISALGGNKAAIKRRKAQQKTKPAKRHTGPVNWDDNAMRAEELDLEVATT